MGNLSIEQKVDLVLSVEEAIRTEISVTRKHSTKVNPDSSCNLCGVNLNSNYIHITTIKRYEEKVQEYDVCYSCYEDILEDKWNPEARAFAA